jgi:S1-C subfamily serine protease
LTYIINQETKSLKIKKSDLAKESLALANNLPEILANSFIFDLKGDLVAFFINGRDMKLVSDLNTLIKGLLNKEKKFRPSLGVNYVELSEFALKQNFSVKKGALIYPDSEGVAIIKDSVAEKSGLKEGDIIISLDNIEISRDNDLAHLLLKYVAGDEITLLYRRGVSEERIKIVLDRLK